MTFPIQAAIAQSNPDFPTATILKIDGNAGGIPPSFQYALLKGAAVLKVGVSAMTAQQWDSWSAGSNDEAYILTSVASNLGVTLA